MCGLTGFVDFKKNSDSEILIRMAESIKHRGPDDNGFEIVDEAACRVGLGFKRLAILDLSPAGHQPMKNPDTGDLIILNGEIYNFREIRNELETSGIKFRSTGDTEVVMRSYERWGIECVSRFIGMFAIVIYDKRNRKLVCIRDRAGVKPFYYYWKNDLFLFGSELKTFHQHPDFKKEINTDSLAYYFKHGYISSPNSIFKDAFQLEPGSWLELSFDGKKITRNRYWNINDYFNKFATSMSYEEVVHHTESLLVSAFNYRMVSDVPVGVFLSGGYDSSCVAAILQKNNATKIKTYTIGFAEEGYNEAPYAKKVAEYIGTDHQEYYCSFTDAMEIVPKLGKIYDQPFGDSSAVPTTLISKIAREHVTVALSADGGDELFGGYPRHIRSLKHINRYKRIPSFAKRIISRLLPMNDKSLVTADRMDKLKSVFNTSNESEMFDIINQTFSKSELSKLLNVSFAEAESPFYTSKKLSSKVQTLNKILATDYNTYLIDDILQKVDRASMSVSLEAREPFLDHRLIEFIATVPSEFKIDGSLQKKILKDIVHKYIPAELMQRPKMGFGIPLHAWCKNELKDLFMSFMSDDAISANPYLNLKNVSELRDGYLNNQLHNFERIWFVFVFQMWFREWMS